LRCHYTPLAASP